jgi:hypothetical protein
VPAQWNFDQIGDVVATYSGGPSLSGVPAGSRREGKEFELAVRKAWIIFAQEVRSVATIEVVLRFRFAARRSEYVALFDCFANFLGTAELPPLNHRSVRPS